MHNIFVGQRIGKIGNSVIENILHFLFHHLNFLLLLKIYSRSIYTIFRLFSMIIFKKFLQNIYKSGYCSFGRATYKSINFYIFRFQNSAIFESVSVSSFAKEVYQNLIHLQVNPLSVSYQKQRFHLY